jgi:AraC family transcriptional regulator
MRPQTDRDYRQRVLRVLVHIEQHLDDSLALDDLAALAHFSPFHFHRIFRAMVGESVIQYVRRLRLERAARRLKSTSEPVIRLALEAGYDSHEAFTRAFGASFRVPPSEFRKEHARPSPATIAVRVDALEPMEVAFIRHVGPYHDVGRAWSALMEWAGRSGVLRERPTLLGISHDDPEITDAGHVRYDACVVVDAGVQPEGDVGRCRLPGGDHAIATHVGPYDKLGDSYADLCGRWLPESGRDPGWSPGFERYLNSPADVPPERLVTEICIPLEITCE